MIPRRQVGPAAALCWAACVAAPGSPRAQALDLAQRPSQHARARAYELRVRFEPERRAGPGQCLELGVDALGVSLRGRPVRDPARLTLVRDEQPTVHALLLDTSASMAGRLGELRAVASTYIRQLDPARESALLVGIDENVTLHRAATADRDRLVAAIDGLRMGRNTSLNDALFFTLAELEGQRERPVILVVTDGVDSGSLHERHDVLERLPLLPDLTVFTIGLGLPPIAGVGPTGVNSARKFLQQLAARTRGAFFDSPTTARLPALFRRIREMLDAEATLIVEDAEPERPPGAVRVTSRRDGCRVRVLDGDAREGGAARRDALPDAPPALPHTLALSFDARLTNPFTHNRRSWVDPLCARAGRTDDERPESFWFAEVRADRIEGCALDLTMDYGPVFHAYGQQWTLWNDWIGLKTRPFEVPLPALDALPERPEQWLDRLAEHALGVAAQSIEIDTRLLPVDDHARPFHDYTMLDHGSLFFDLRTTLAAAAYAHPDYRAWAREHLRQEAEADLAALGEAFRRRVPDASEAERVAAVEQSEQAARIRARAESPTAIDTQRLLAAWLGDLPAHDLFVRWEADRVRRRLEPAQGSAAGASFALEWTELRRIFFVPSYARMLALLAPVHDPTQNRIGYWRIVLPRLHFISERIKGWRDHPELSDLPLDLVPDLPLGYWLVDRLIESRPDAGIALARAGCAPRGVRYELLGKPGHHDPRRAFRHSEVSIDLMCAEGALELTAEVRLEPQKRREGRASRPRREKRRWAPSGDPPLEPRLVRFEQRGAGGTVLEHELEEAASTLLAGAAVDGEVAESSAHELP